MGVFLYGKNINERMISKKQLYYNLFQLKNQFKKKNIKSKKE